MGLASKIIARAGFKKETEKLAEKGGKKLAEKEGKGLAKKAGKKKLKDSSKESQGFLRRNAGKIGLGVAGGSAAAIYSASGTGEGECDPFGGNYADCMGKKIKKIFTDMGDTIKKYAIYGIIAIIILGVLLKVLGSIISSTFDKKMNTAFDETHPYAENMNNVAIPSSNYSERPGPVSMSGGGKNNLDKYMYCLILLLGIGIHHLYVNYEKKINQYLELIDKEKDELIY